MIAFSHALLDHGQVRMKDTHTDLDILVNVPREMTPLMVIKEVGDAPMDIERPEKKKESE